MRGRKPKPKPIDNVVAFPGAAVEPVAPPVGFKGDRALGRCWRRVVAEMQRAGTYSEDCRDLVEAYCFQYVRWRNAEVTVAKDGAIVAAPNSGVPMHSPHLAVANGAFDRMLRLAAELGLTPASRGRVERTGNRGQGSAARAFINRGGKAG